LAALKRFNERRGVARSIYCDNATNFVGPKIELRELKTTIYLDKAREIITKTCSQIGTEFHFIPPRAPHFGGLREAAVKSAKYLLIELDYELPPHPPYFPDLAPCYFFLFLNLKKSLAGQKFESNEEVVAATEAYFPDLEKTYSSDGWSIV